MTLNRKIEIIDLGNKINEIIYKILIQVNDPKKIDPKILNDFVGENRTEKVRLIKGAETCEGEILTLYPYSMGIKPLDNDFKLNRDDNILVQFKHSRYEQQFVIQAVVKRMYSSWANMECQDPRDDQRYNFKLQEEVEFFELPQIFYDLIKKREVNIIRETLHQSLDEGKKAYQYIENIYPNSNLDIANLKHSSLDEQYFHTDYKRIFDTTPLKGDLRDVSQGGICILVDEKLYDKRNLLLVRFKTPSIENKDKEFCCNPLSFSLLGSVRSFSMVGRRQSLHVQFLKKLEESHLEDTFSTLEKYYKLTGRPL
ncbi:MAG: PilZ domain-containing protein, partial [Deltaproteobacteria bacterium]|nr:PilZ domain-containing protein [Deltaproteobacteria bacterium]